MQDYTPHEKVLYTNTFNNQLKVCFSNKKNTIATQTRLTQNVKVYFK